MKIGEKKIKQGRKSEDKTVKSKATKWAKQCSAGKGIEDCKKQSLVLTDL